MHLKFSGVLEFVRLSSVGSGSKVLMTVKVESGVARIAAVLSNDKPHMTVMERMGEAMFSLWNGLKSISDVSTMFNHPYDALRDL